MCRKYIKCIKCGLKWNVFEKVDLKELYICLYCEQKILDVKTKDEKHRYRKGSDRLTKVLLRNKSKFNCL